MESVFDRKIKGYHYSLTINNDGIEQYSFYVRIGGRIVYYSDMGTALNRLYDLQELHIASPNAIIGNYAPDRN